MSGNPLQGDHNVDSLQTSATTSTENGKTLLVGSGSSAPPLSADPPSKRQHTSTTRSEGMTSDKDSMSVNTAVFIPLDGRGDSGTNTRTRTQSRSVSVQHGNESVDNQNNCSSSSSINGPVGTIDEQLVEVALSSKLVMVYGLYYWNDDHEDAFLVHELKRCFFRSNVAHIIVAILLVASGLDELRREDQNSTIMRTCMVSGIIIFIAALVGWLLVRHYFSHNEYHETKRKSQGNRSTKAQPPSDEQGSSEETEEGIHGTSWLHRHTPRLHEMRCLICAVVFSLSVTVMYSVKQEHCRYARLGRNDNVPEDNHDCPFHLWGVMPWGYIIWIVVGQPRLIYFGATALCLIIQTLSFVHFHGLEPLEVALVFCFLFTMLMCMVALKWFDEQRSRRQFEVMFALEEQRAEVHERTAQLHDFVKRITPEHLRKSRLANISAGVVSVDIATEATCVVLFVANAVSFMHSMRPSDAASSLARITSHAQHICKNFALHHIHSMGDHMYFVSNLFNEDTPTSSAATLNGIRFITSFWSLPAPWSKLDFQTGVSYGELTGLPIGTTVIHYDVLGPALTEADALSKVCKPRRIAISEAVYNAHRPYLATDPSDASSGAGHVLVKKVLDGDVVDVDSGDLQYSTTDLNKSDGSVEQRGSMTSASSLTTLAARIHHGLRQGHIPAARDGTIDTYGCFFKRFKDTAMESAFGVLQSTEAATTVQLVGGFYLIMAAFVLAVTAIYFASRSDDKGGGLLEQSNGLVFLVMWIVAVLCFLAVVVMARLKGTVSTSMRMLLFTGSILMFVGTSLMRPSPMANGMGYQLIIFSVGCLYCGASGPMLLVYLCILTTFHIVMGLVHNSLVTRVFFFTIPQMLVFVNTGLHFHQQERSLVAARLNSYIAIREIKAHEQVRKAVLRSIIPRQVESRMNPDALKTGKIECWTRDDCVVISVLLSQAKASSWGDAATSSHHAEAISRVEAIVASCQYSSLDIVSVFGGALLIAGPLDAQQQEKGVSLERAIADATEIIEAMLADSTIKFTAAVVFEQIVNAARCTMYPSYEVFGPAVNMARSLSTAAPAEMAVATDKFANFYSREVEPKKKQPTTTKPHALQIAPTETWRIRGVGSMSVCRLQLTNQESNLTAHGEKNL